MVKQLTFAAFVISIGLIWLTGGWRVAEAYKGADHLSHTIAPASLRAILNTEASRPLSLAETRHIEAQATPAATPTVTSTGTQPSLESTPSPETEEPGSSFLASVGPLTLIAAILLTLAIVGFALVVIFMAAHKYSEWLNREMPQPIYTQERRLLTVIENSVKAIIEQTMGHDRVNGQERHVQVGIVEFERTANAGVNLKLNVDTEERPDSEGEAFRQLLTYIIEADRWGRISKMKLEGVPRYIAIERVTLINADGGGDDQETDGGQAIPANGHLLPSGEDGTIDSFMSQNETMISVTSRRKFWRQ